MRATTVLFVLGMIVGCSMEQAARPYPENDTAAAQAVVQARFIARGLGRRVGHRLLRTAGGSTRLAGAFCLNWRTGH